MQPVRMPLALIGLVVFQGLLGMWTVTLLLKPLIVVAHLARRPDDAGAAVVAGADATRRHAADSPSAACAARP